MLVTTSLGAGVLTLPYVNKQNGIVLGSSMLVFGAIVSYISMRLLMWESYATNIVDYAELVEHCFGKVRYFVMYLISLSRKVESF